MSTETLAPAISFSWVKASEGRTMNDMPRVLAVVPARGGSKGIPGKNIMPLGGVPLIGRTVRAARACPAITDVVVTTDDPRIAEVARQYGADIVDRPAELATDRASSESAVLHALQTWTQRANRSYDIILLPQNTSPFHDPGDMAAVIEQVASGKCNACITVLETYRYFWGQGENGWHMPYQKRANRQNRGPWYAEAGSLYCVRRELFEPAGNLFPAPVGVHVIPEWRALELDEPRDVQMAELLCKLMETKASTC